MAEALNSSCVFCSPPQDEVFYRGKLVYGLWDKFPVSEGHALLIPHRHVHSWFDATEEEQVELLRGIGIAKTIIESQHVPDGFNIGINDGMAAGQTVAHLHVHIIPRYPGDVPDPRGGIRHVIPARANYLADPFGHSYSIPKVPHQQALIRGDEDPFLPHLLAHIDLAQEVDIAVAFTRDSGFRQIKSRLQEVLDRGGKIRFLTGDYLDITEPDALKSLLDLTGDVERRVYQVHGNSFHPKAYIFRNDQGEGVAIVGSSNLSDMALTKGVEWNYRTITTRDLAGYNDVCQVFDALFKNPSTVILDDDWVSNYQKSRKPASPEVAGIEKEVPELPPEPYDVQQEAMDALERSREEGNQAGLVVLATGLGKTWLSAFDSQREGFKRILFVAHREEILAQARETFRRVYPQARLGYYTGQEKDAGAQILFASVQTLSRAEHLRAFEPREFDYIVMDEFHHASASTYRKIIDYFEPLFLLGLTATPERTDGGDLLQLCQENLVFRCDILEGINRDLLCPFHYFGVPDDIEYAQIPWRSGKFAEEELTAHWATQSRAQNILKEYTEKAGKRTLAFCCSQLHADFMKQYFLQRDVKAAVVHSGKTSDPRTTSLEQLRDGKLNIVFSVDMFNEGLDIPNCDTIMMLRPTESRLLWLQQLGRGLRKSEGKEFLTVIDYIGNHKSFLTKTEALLEIFFTLGIGYKALREQLEKIKNHTLALPPGCEVTYDLEVIDVIKALMGPTAPSETLGNFYKDFESQHGFRPTAAQTFHEGYNPRSAQDEHGSWLQMVGHLGGLSDLHQAIVANDLANGFLTELETTRMVKSYKMVMLLAMLNTNALPGSIGIDQLTHGFRRLAERSSQLRADVSVSLKNEHALRRLLEENPINAFTQSTEYFTYENGVFRFVPEIPENQKEGFQELVRELVDWRLSDYLSRHPEMTQEDFACKVSHSGGKPILFLPDRKKTNLPSGWQDVMAENEVYEANFVEIAVNVMRRKGSQENILADVLRNWFGQDAGLPGTTHRVVFTPEGENGYRLKPAGKGDEGTLPEVWASYNRQEIPPLFDLKFNTGAWNKGYVYKDNHAFLLVTLDKGSLHSDFQFQDRFVNANQFQWQSQNSTTQESNTGQRLCDHERRNVKVHLFVRETKIRSGKATPFTYCGEVSFISWAGEKPITIQWQLKDPVPPRLWSRLDVPET
jgi:superfamily II DNA or RNA helicase/diadenosine tetraphosphate (Ap4A) HIT family hydrolase